jgi:hypothetical protein
VHELREKIEAETDELASSNPHRQRLVLLAWVAMARSFQARSCADEVYDGVRASASRFSLVGLSTFGGSLDGGLLELRDDARSCSLRCSVSSFSRAFTAVSAATLFFGRAGAGPG